VTTSSEVLGDLFFVIAMSAPGQAAWGRHVAVDLVREELSDVPFERLDGST
jgi:hypothetical protein